MYFDVFSRMKNMRIVPVSVAADGSLASTNRHVSSEKLDTGQYKLTLLRSCQQEIFIFPTTRADGVARHIAQVPKANLAANSGRVYTYSYADAAADAPFDAIIVGSDGRTPTFQIVQNLVYCGLNRPRMVTFNYDGAGDSLYGKNRNNGTFVKTGTGLYTLTLKQKFQNTPVVIAVTSSTTRHVEVVTKTNGVITFATVNSSSAAAADAEIFVMVFGSDSRQVFQRSLNVLKAPDPLTFLNPFEYNGSTDAMVRAAQSFTKVKNGAGDYSFTRRKIYARAGFAMAASGAAAANVVAVNNRTKSGFKVTSEADASVYALDIGYAQGRTE